MEDRTNDAPVGADALLREARETWPRDPGAAIARLAAGLAELERHGAVREPERVRLTTRLAQLRLFLGEVDGALVTLRRAGDPSRDGYLALQLASALGWRGDADDEAAALAEAALAAARRTRDGPLAIAALCLTGEAALAAGDADEAVRRFGEALGISEFSVSDAVSVAPLAGLARAHRAGRAPGKAPGLARRALARAEAAGDEAGRARALEALADAEDDPALLLRAAEAADAAPHRPLALRLRRRALAAGAGGDAAALARAARAMGLRADAEALLGRGDSRGGGG